MPSAQQKVTLNLQPVFFTECLGPLTDQFGVNWFVVYYPEAANRPRRADVRSRRPRARPSLVTPTPARRLAAPQRLVDPGQGWVEGRDEEKQSGAAQCHRRQPMHAGRRGGDGEEDPGGGGGDDGTVRSSTSRKKFLKAARVGKVILENHRVRIRDLLTVFDY